MPAGSSPPSDSEFKPGRRYAGGLAAWTLGPGWLARQRVVGLAIRSDQFARLPVNSIIGHSLPAAKT
jgi:hypothetical protein